MLVKIVSRANDSYVKKTLLSIILLVLTGLSVPETFAQENVLNAVFEPVASLNIAGMYDTHSSFIDFLLYLVLFIGVAQSKLATRFAGRGGKAVIIVVGLILAISLASSSFTIRRMWPVAAGILIFLVASIIFFSIKHVLESSAVSGAVAFVVAYFVMRSVFPEYFELLAQNKWANLFHSLVYVAVLIALFRIPLAIMPRGSGRLKAIAARVAEPTKALANKALSRAEEQRRKELAVERKEFGKEKKLAIMLERITKKEVKDSRQIIQDLQDICTIIERYGDTKQARKLISKKITKIIPKRHDLEARLNDLKELVNRLERFNITLFDQLRDSYAKLSGREKKLVKKELKQELEKVRAEKEIIGRLEPRVEQYNRDMEIYLSAAMKLLVAGDLSNAVAWLEQAITYETGIQNLAQKMRQLEHLIRKITKKEFKFTEQEEEQDRAIEAQETVPF